MTLAKPARIGDVVAQVHFLTTRQLFDATGGPPLMDAAVLVDGVRVKAIGHRAQLQCPASAVRIDVGECTLLPGIIDAHMHFFGVASDSLHTLPTESEAYRALRAAGEAKKMLEAGVTTARCLGSSVGPQLRRAVNEGHVPGPRIHAAGQFICSTNGTWDHVTLPLEWMQRADMIADGPEAITAIVRRRARQGANVIKVGLSHGTVDDQYHAWGDDPTDQSSGYSHNELIALTREAHANQLRVSAHCIGDAAVRQALDGGVDVIEHGYGITDDTRRRLVDENAIVVSTIAQLYFHQQAQENFHYAAWEKAAYARHIEVMRADFEKSLGAGVRYALGTDLIGYPTHPQDRAAKEFELANTWGMSAEDALIAGTKVSAEALGIEHIVGTIETGKIADIIAVSGDPLKDVRAMQQVCFVMQGGKVVRSHSTHPTTTP